MIIFLKILKIVFIIIIIIILLILLLTLFSINFALEIKGKDNTSYKLRINYILNAIEFKISYIEELKMSLRILFINIDLIKKIKNDTKKKIKNKINDIKKFNKQLIEDNKNKIVKLVNNKKEDKIVSYKDVKKFDKELDKIKNNKIKDDENNTKNTYIKESSNKKKSLISKYIELSENDKKYIKNKLIILIQNLIKIFKPKKFKIDCTFGYDDPYEVGKVLAILGILYERFGDNIKVKPIFNENIFKGDIYIKGSFRLISIIIIAIKLILDKKVRYFLWKM